MNRIMAHAIYYNLKRLCNLNEASHWSRVSSSAYGLEIVKQKMGQPSNLQKSAAEGFSHDTAEKIYSR